MGAGRNKVLVKFSANPRSANTMVLKIFEGFCGWDLVKFLGIIQTFIKVYGFFLTY